MTIVGALNRELASSGGRSLFSDSLKLKLYQLRGQLKFSATDMQKSELFFSDWRTYVCMCTSQPLLPLPL